MGVRVRLELAGGFILDFSISFTTWFALLIYLQPGEAD